MSTALSNESLLTQLRNITYSEAIDHYNYLKQRFFMDFATAADKTEKEVEEFFTNEIVREINDNPIEGQEQQAENLLNQIRNNLVSKVQGSSQGLQTLRNDLREQARQKTAMGQEAWQKGAESLMSAEELKKTIVRSLPTGSFEISDILNQVRGYRNKWIATRDNSNYKYYKRSVKGYYREALVHEAFSKLSELLDSRTVAISTGSKTYSDKNVDTIYDEYINFFGNLDGQFDLLINKNIDTGYGIQTKSWITPWTQSPEYLPAWKYSIGSKAALLNQLSVEEKMSWIKSTIALERMAIEAIGQNQAGFVTGDSFYWTGDLIGKFRQQEYYLAFVFTAKNHQITKTVSWQKEQNF